MKNFFFFFKSNFCLQENTFNFMFYLYRLNLHFALEILLLFLVKLMKMDFIM